MAHRTTGWLITVIAIVVVTIGIVGTALAQTPDLPQSSPSLSSPPTQSRSFPAAPSKPEAVLWDQPLSTANQVAYVDQDFPDRPDRTSFLADDFTNSDPWLIDTIFVPGDGWNGFESLLNLETLTWQIYADASGVPDGDPSAGGNRPLWNLSLAPTDSMVTITNGSSGLPSNVTLNLDEPVFLPPGTYWFVFYPTGDFGPTADPFGQYGRQPADTTNGYTAQFINPGNGFGHGTEWQDWAVLDPLRLTQQDQAFRLEGRVTRGTLEGTVTSLGYCDASSEPLLGAEVLITSNTGVTKTLTTDEAGFYSQLLEEADGPYTVRVTYPEHAGDEQSDVIVTGGETTTVDFSLRWLEPCVRAVPSSYDVEVGEGYSYSRLLLLTNDGAAASAFQVEEAGSVDIPWLSEAPVNGTIEADSATEIDVTFDSMTYTIGTQLTATLNVLSDDPFTSTIEIPITMTIAAEAFGVDVGSDQALDGRPGEKVIYQVMVTNTSNGPQDSFDISLSGNSWTTTAPTQIGPLDAWQSAMIDVEVEIPADALNGDTDEVVMTATSVGDLSVSDSITLTTTAVPVYALNLEPADAANSGTPGETLTYTLLLNNLEDATRVDLTLSGNNWDVRLPTGSFNLQKGESVQVEVHVSIDADALNGDMDAVTLTATGAGGATDSSVLTTTAVVDTRLIFLPMSMNVHAP